MTMVAVAQSVRASDCGSEGCGFDSRQSPLIEETHWDKILHNVTTSPLVSFLDYYPEMKTKDLSCNVSAVLTMEAARYFNSIGQACRVERTDKDPDLYFSELDIAVEIKTTRCRENTNPKWMGGGYSKRSGLNILVAWDRVDTNLDGNHGYKFYITSCNLDKALWKTLGADYYATGISLKEIPNRIDIIGTSIKPKFYYVP